MALRAQASFHTASHCVGGRAALGGSPEKFQRDGAPGLRLHALPPELELRVDGAVEQEVLAEAFRVKRTDWGVVADLLGYEPESQVFPRQGSKREREGSPLVTAKPKKAGRSLLAPRRAAMCTPASGPTPGRHWEQGATHGHHTWRNTPTCSHVTVAQC